MNTAKNFSAAHSELEHDLRCQIYRKQLLPGEKLFSELHYARKYHISRTTVRKAMDALVAENLIFKVRGAGTFVAESKNVSRKYPHSGDIRSRQILFLSFFTAFPEKTLYMQGTFEPIFNGLSRVLNQCRCNVLFSHVNSSWEAPACLLNDDVAGIVFHGQVQTEFWNKYMAHLPCVAINHDNLQIGCSMVGLDNQKRSFCAVKHLYELGHRKIGFAGVLMPESLSEVRYWGYQRAIRHFGLEEYVISLPQDKFRSELRAERTAEDLVPYLQRLKANDRPTALLIPNDFDFYNEALKLMDIKVPEDLSVVGGSNLLLGNENAETYICDRLEDICIESARLIVEMIGQGDGWRHKKILLTPKLIRGFSTAPLEI